MAYGEGFIFKIAGRSCWYYELPGKPPVRRSTKIPVLPADVKPKDVAKEEEKSRKLADKFLEALKRKHESGEERLVPVGSIATTTVLIDRYLEDIRLQLAEGGKSPTTYNTYRGQADNHLKPFFGAYKPAEIESEMIRTYRTKRSNDTSLQGNNRKTGATTKKIKQITINRELALLRAVLNDYAEAHSGFTVPTFKMTNEDGNVRTGFIRYEQFEQKLIPELPFHLQGLATCAFCCGGRAKEWLRLDWDDIDLESGIIIFDKIKFRKRSRTISIQSDEMCERLVELKRIRDTLYPSQKAVFTYNGERLKTINKAWDKACRRAFPEMETTLVFHDMRRSANVLMKENFVSQADRMAIMGHQTASMDKRYGIVDQISIHNSCRAVREALRKKRDAIKTDAA